MTDVLDKVPEELRGLILDFIVSCLIEKPDDFMDYGYQYFNNIVTCRDNVRKIDFHQGRLEIDENMKLIDDEETKQLRSIMNSKRRKSVCSEIYDPQSDDFDAHPVYPKSDEERKMIYEYMDDVILFSSLGEEEKQVLIDVIVPRDVTAGEKIIKQHSEIDNNFYLIDHGTFESFVTTGTGEEKIIHTYENKGCFGEIALMYCTPSYLTVRAITNGKLWVLNRQLFRSIILKEAHRRRSTLTNFIENVPFMSKFTLNNKLDLADALVIKNYVKGETIFQEGDFADGMYLIVSGEVSLSVTHPMQGRIVIAELKEGDHIGQLSLLSDKPRGLNATAKSDAKLAFLDGNAFERLQSKKEMNNYSNENLTGGESSNDCKEEIEL